MKTATIEVSPLDHPHWIAKLKSHKHDLGKMESRLAELAMISHKPGELARIEHFQNQFIVQKSNVNDVLHHVKMDEKELRFEQLIRSAPGPSHRHSKELAEGFDRTMNELKKDFESFVDKFGTRQQRV